MTATPTVRDLFDAALRRYAIANGDDPATLYICVPHQLPPLVKDSDWYPPDPEAGDQYVAGDHDYLSVMPLADGLTYRGHQYAEVHGLAVREISSLLPAHWMERVLCRLYAGHPMSDPNYRMLWDDLSWDGVWPEVDGDLLLTGELVGDDEDYASVLDDAMMQVSVAEEAGLVVSDGYVQLPGGND